MLTVTGPQDYKCRQGRNL